MINDILDQKVIDLFESYSDGKELIELELEAMFLDVQGDLTQSQFLSTIDFREAIKILFNIRLNNLTWYTKAVAPFGKVVSWEHDAYVQTLTPRFYIEDEKGLLPISAGVNFRRFGDQDAVSMNGTDSKWLTFDNLDKAIEVALEQLTDLELELRNKEPKIYKNKS